MSFSYNIRKLLRPFSNETLSCVTMIQNVFGIDISVIRKDNVFSIAVIVVYLESPDIIRQKDVNIRDSCRMDGIQELTWSTRI